MRRLQFAMHLLIATITVVAAGCRQTASTSPTGALVPLSPNTGSAAPTFQPFGGQTRVTPPPTGSYGVPNNYLGGSAPVGQVVNPSAAVGGFAANQNPPVYGPTSTGSGVIGSGVMQTGWSETGANVTQPNNPNPGTYGPGVGGPAPGPVAPSRNLRSGGMQVIDLTSAPAPPGYRGNFVPQTGFSTPSISRRDFSQPPSFAPIRSVPAPQPNNFTSVNSAPAGVIAGVPQFEPRQIAGGQAPSANGNLTPVNSAPPLNPVASQSPAASQGPVASQSPAASQSPVASQGSGQPNNLPWRNPGTQY